MEEIRRECRGFLEGDEIDAEHGKDHVNDGFIFLGPGSFASEGAYGLLPARPRRHISNKKGRLHWWEARVEPFIVELPLKTGQDQVSV